MSHPLLRYFKDNKAKLELQTFVTGPGAYRLVLSAPRSWAANMLEWEFHVRVGGRQQMLPMLAEGAALLHMLHRCRPHVCGACSKCVRADAASSCA